MDCLFCKILNGDIPSNKVYEDEKTYAFYDISPMAKTHILVIPKKHYDCVANADKETIADVFTAITNITKQLGITDFRVVANNGEEAGQTVFHLHFHILAGEKLGPMC